MHLFPVPGPASCGGLGRLLALKVMAANKQERAEVAALAAKLQKTTGEHAQIA